MKIIINYLIKFIQSISLVIIVFSSIMLLTVFNKHYVYDLLENNNYYPEIYEVSKESVGEYLEQSGLPDTTLDTVMSEELVTNNVNKIIEAFYNNKSIEIDSEEFKNKLTNSINNYISENNITGTTEKEITTLVEKLVSIYEEEISYNNTLEKVRTLFHKVFRYMKLALGISILTFMISYIINRFIFKERNLILSTFTCTIILQGFILYVKANIDIENISFYNTSISNILKDFINSVLYNVSFSSIIIFIMGILLALFSSGVIKDLCNRPKLFHSALLIMWMLVIFMFSQANGNISTKTSNLVTQAVVSVSTNTNEITHEEYKNKVLSSTYLIRKTAHFIEYMILGILVILLLNDYGKLNIKMLICAVALCIIYAVTDEIHQLFIEGRTARVFDVFIDSVGSLIGIVSYSFINKKKFKSHI